MAHVTSRAAEEFDDDIALVVGSEHIEPVADILEETGNTNIGSKNNNDENFYSDSSQRRKAKKSRGLMSKCSSMGSRQLDPFVN